MTSRNFRAVQTYFLTFSHQNRLLGLKSGQNYEFISIHQFILISENTLMPFRQVSFLCHQEWESSWRCSRGNLVPWTGLLWLGWQMNRLHYLPYPCTWTFHSGLGHWALADWMLLALGTWVLNARRESQPKGKKLPARHREPSRHLAFPLRGTDIPRVSENLSQPLPEETFPKWLHYQVFCK